MKNKIICFVKLLLGVVFLVTVDQVTKLLAVANLKDKPDFVLIDKFFSLHYLENEGAAWGMLAGKTLPLIGVAMLAFIIMGFLYIRIPNEKQYTLLKTVFFLIMSGAVGNLIDRGVRGFVVDFLYFEWINFPVFNVADIYVTVGAVILVIGIFTIYRKDEFGFWSFKRNKVDE